MFGLLGGAVVVAYHVVSAFALLLAPLPGGLAGAAAIVLFTVAVRLVLLPLSYYAIRGQASQARLGHQVQALRARHAGHPERLQSEMAALYRREGGGAAAGCLPLLLQLPFLSVLYTLLRSGTVGGKPNLLLGRHLFAAPLGSHWLSGPGPFSAQGAVFLGLFVLLAGALWLAARVAARVTRTPASRQGAGAGAAQPDSAQPDSTTGLLVRAVPYVTLVIAAIMPLAAGLYLLTTTAWAAGERAVLAPRIASRPVPRNPGGAAPRPLPQAPPPRRPSSGTSGGRLR